MKKSARTGEKHISKDEYISSVLLRLEGITEESAIDLVSLGAEQDFINDNDIFEAIHSYLGCLEVPMPKKQRSDLVLKIRRLIKDYDKEKKRPTSWSLL